MHTHISKCMFVIISGSRPSRSHLRANSFLPGFRLCTCAVNIYTDDQRLVEVTTDVVWSLSSTLRRRRRSVEVITRSWRTRQDTVWPGPHVRRRPCDNSCSEEGATPWWLNIGGLDRIGLQRAVQGRDIIEVHLTSHRRRSEILIHHRRSRSLMSLCVLLKELGNTIKRFVFAPLRT